MLVPDSADLESLLINIESPILTTNGTVKAVFLHSFRGVRFRVTLRYIRSMTRGTALASPSTTRRLV